MAHAANAVLIRTRLAASYPDIEVIAASTDAGRVYRVRMGAFLERAQAERRAADLAAFGYYSTIIAE